MLKIDGFAQESSQDVLPEIFAGAAPEHLSADGLNNASSQPTQAGPGSAPCTASIYQLDGLVRRASSLQMTADARATAEVHA
jgi:NADH-quinone oxidoreductase subunit G